MSHVLYPSAGHIVLEADGVITWSTDRRPINLLPESEWIEYAATIAFPDFDHYNAYYLGDSGSTTVLGSTIGQCASFVTIRGGEYGPGSGGDKALSETVIGTVPAGVNALEVYVQLTRTNAPSNYLSFSIDNLVPDNELIYLPGGSCICERAPAGKWTRGFEVVLDGTNIVLRRYQSVFMGGGSTEDWRPLNDTGSTFLSFLGWTYRDKNSNSAGATGGQGRNAFVAQSIEGKTGTANIHRGGANGCSVTDTTDYSATWAGTIYVRPGYVGEGVTQNVPSKIKCTGVYDVYVNGTVATIPSMWCDRDYTIVAIAATKGPAASSSRTISGVTVNGVAASELALRASFIDNASNDFNTIAGLYVVPTPASHLAAVVATFSGAVDVVGCAVFSCDDLLSLTPDASFSTGAVGAQSLATVDGGIAIFAEASVDSTSVSGITNGFVKGMVPVGGSPVGYYLFGFQNTDGTTMSIDPTTGATANRQASVAVSLH